MTKIVKWVGFVDLILILFQIYAKIKLDLSVELSSFLVGLTIGITFFVIFTFIVIHIKNFIFIRKNKNKKIKATSDKLIYILGIIFSSIIIILVFNYSLYFQALTGKDLFLTLSLDKENFALNNGDTLSITAKLGIITNPFCSANCDLSLRDLSSGDILFSENLAILVSNPLSRNYEIRVNEEYAGQKLYRLDLECISERKLFCYTATNNSKHASKIISVEHALNKNQSQYLTEIKNKITSLNNNYSQLILNLNEINNFIFTSKSLDLSKFITKTTSLDSVIKENNMDLILKVYNQQNFSQLEGLLQKKETSMQGFNDLFKELGTAINLEINSYNNLVEDIYALKTNASNLYSIKVDSSSLTNFNNFIDSFNSNAISFTNKGDLNNKENILKNLIALRTNLNLSDSSGESLKLEKTLNDINISYLHLNLSEGNFNLSLSDPSPICCLSKKCGICLNESYSSTNYPIILLHGHSFNEQISALGSLESFDSFQKKLENDGYVNAGSLIYLDYSSTSKNILGKINSPVSIKASYYYDVLSTAQGNSLLETKTDNIDTYSIRLKDIVENVKYITGKDKVIIIAHSMGGLVARRYIQLFGESNVDKLILIAVPNQGVDGFVVDYCAILGTGYECNDMNSNSLFLNKLNRGDKPNIPVYNIIGQSCTGENSNGDGIVKNNSAYLTFAKNYYVDGTCEGFSYFHNTILEIDNYPQVYDLVKKILGNLFP